jgi:hypothetical protein
MARDKVHNAARIALEKDGWLITHDPYQVKVLDVEYEIDLGAEELVAAEKGGRKIAIEIKSFLQGSFVYEFHGVLGQFLNYGLGLEEQEPDRELYLAVPVQVYRTFFAKAVVQKAITRFNLKLVLFDPQQQTIVEWKQ